MDDTRTGDAGADADAEAVDLSDAPKTRPSLALAWRNRAVELAIQQHMNGKVYFVDSVMNTDGKFGTYMHYRCSSATEPDDHDVMLTLLGEVICDCTAARLYRPCSHAGATLLFSAGLTPERRHERE